MNLLEKNRLENEYSELVQQKLSYILKKLMVPEWLNIRIRQLAQVLGLSARYASNPKQNFLYSLSKLYKKVKYGLEEERAAFEKTRKEQPHDFNNRLVYSDWLREQGEDEEADFQKSMAEWLRDKAPTALKQKNMDYSDDIYPEWKLIHDQPYQMDEDRGAGYPEGVNPRQFIWQHSNRGGLSDRAYRFTNPDAALFHEVWQHHPVDEEPDGTLYHGYLNRFAWPSFEHMEKAFRKAYRK